MTNTQLRLPMQAAPIDRTPGGGALNGDGGMEPSAWYDDLWGAVKPAIPGLVGGLASMI